MTDRVTVNPHAGRTRTLELHPLEVARAWARAITSKHLAAALSLYATDAVLHADGGTISGRSHLQAYLERSPLLRERRDPTIRGKKRVVLLRWDAMGDRAALEVRCRVVQGELAEQWIAEVSSEDRTVELVGGVETSVVTRGDVAEEAVDYAMKRLSTVLDEVEDGALFARVKLTRAPDPALERPALAEVMLDIDGHVVRAHAAAHEMHAAIDLLQRRLRDQLRHRAEHRDWQRKRTGSAEPGHWRHGDLPAERPGWFLRPDGERDLVRHKAFVADEMTPDEAAFDLDQLDYDFYLFRDLGTGEDALIERGPDRSYRLTLLHPVTVDRGPTAAPVVVADQGAPRLTVDEAVANLDATGERFVFFANADSGRGNVVYHRYDGHHGLIALE